MLFLSLLPLSCLAFTVVSSSADATGGVPSLQYYCLDSYKDGNLIYSNEQNGSNLNMQLLTKDELEELVDVLFLYVNVSITVPGTVNSTAVSDSSAVELYVLASSGILASIGAQVLDIETFSALSAVQRSRALTLKAVQSSICNTGDSIITMFARAHGLNGVIPLTIDSSSSLYSYITIYSVMAIFSMLADFVFLRYLVARCIGKLNRHDSSVKCDIFQIGVYLVSLCFTCVYLFYWILQTYNFFTTLGDNLYWPHISFIINGIVICLMTLVTVIVAALFEAKNWKMTQSSNNAKLTPLLKLFKAVGSCCAKSLVVCFIYHIMFLLIALITDYKTTLYEVSYLLTYLTISLVGLPTVIMQFLITRSTKQYCYLVIICVTMLSIPCLYFSGVYGIQQLINNSHFQTYSTDAIQLVLVLAISTVSVLVTLSVASLVFKQNIHNLASRLNTTNGGKSIQGARNSVKKPAGPSVAATKEVDKYGAGDGRSKAVAMILIGNPSVLLTRMMGMKKTAAKSMTDDVSV